MDELIDKFGGITHERVKSHAQVLEKKVNGNNQLYQIDKDSSLVPALLHMGGTLEPEIDGFRRISKKSYDTYYPIVLNQNKELPVCDQLVAILHPPTNEDIISVSPGAALEKGKPNDVLEMQLVKQFFIEIVGDVCFKYKDFPY